MVIIKADSTKELPLKSNSIDAIVTDPPYGLEFMGKEWDKLWDKREFGIDEYSKKSYTCSDGSTRKSNPVSRKLSNPNYKAGIEAQLWHTYWLSEAYRVLKPGGSMLTMGGARTFHRLACALEDSGFIIKDTLMWIYGSGFPKAQEVSVLVDAKILGISTKEVKKRRENVTIPLTPEGEYWNGFKVGGVKPAYEPIVWAVKPPEGAYVDNVLKYGIGAVNVDESRASPDMQDYKSKQHNKGRFPANIMLSHHPECQQIGVKRVRGAWSNKGITKNKRIFNADLGQNMPANKDKYYDSKGYETVESWNCHPDCAVRILDEQSGELKSGARKGGEDFKLGRYKDQKGHWGIKKGGTCESSSGGASRFFYCAKASRRERNVGLELMKDKMFGQSGGAQVALRKGQSKYKQEHIGLNRIKKVKNDHPTVKPIALFQYLIKLVTRKGQIVFDPFVGSGTTVIAALLSERKSIAIDNNSQYLKIAKARIEYWSKLPSQMELI